MGVGPLWLEATLTHSILHKIVKILFTYVKNGVRLTEMMGCQNLSTPSHSPHTNKYTHTHTHILPSFGPGTNTKRYEICTKWYSGVLDWTVSESRSGRPQVQRKRQENCLQERLIGEDQEQKRAIV